MFGGSGAGELADIAAVTRGNNGGFGDGNGWWVLIILFALFGGWGNGGYGGGGNSATQGALTRGDLCMDMNFNDLQNGVRNVSDAVNAGFANLNATICHQQYDTAGLINNMESTIQQGLNAMNVSNLQTANAQNIAALQNQNALQTQIAQCCCDQKALFAQAEYNRATDTCAITRAIQDAAQQIIQNDNCNYRQLHDEQVALQMQAKDAQISALQGALGDCNTQNIVNAAVQNVVNQVRPTPVPAWNVPNPFGYGYNNGCNWNGCCGNVA